MRLERVTTGELIMVVAENGDVTGVPALAVLDVLPKLDKDERQRLVQILTDAGGEEEAVVVLPLSGADLLDVDRLAVLVGGHGVAHAVVEAHKNGTSMATCNPENVAHVMHPDDVEVLS